MAVRPARSAVAAVFRALADDTRLQILLLLGERPLCVCELVEVRGLTQPAVSEHLRRLKDVGLVADERRGTWAFYHLRTPLPSFVVDALGAVQRDPTVWARFARLAPTAACTLPEVESRTRAAPPAPAARGAGSGQHPWQGSQQPPFSPSE